MKTELLGQRRSGRVPARLPQLGAEPLLVLKPEVRNRVRRVVQRLSSDPDLCEDLLQEALLHFWLSERRSPGQTLGWHLRRCRVVARDYLRRGLSLDSLKRRGLACQIEDESQEQPAAPGDLIEEVCASDTIAELSARLSPRERAVLFLLASGLGYSECLLKLHIAGAVLSRSLHRIRRVALQLGLHP
jgi:DNA-directed RNA polymerase specialized sigma24 family protein